MDKADIVSLKYSPGLMKEIVSLIECFRDHGIDASGHLHERYLKLAFESGENFINANYFKKGNIAKTKQCFKIIFKKSKLVLFYNSHPLNLLILFACIFFTPFKRRALVLHEPLKQQPFKNYGKYGFVVLLIEALNKLQSWLCTDVILLSPRASKLYNESRFYSRFCELHEARILLPSPKCKNTLSERKYFSFFGSVVATKKIDWFLDLVEYSFVTGSSNKFLIVSGSELPSDRIETLLSNGCLLTVVNPKVLTDQEISNWLSQSLAVLSMHKSVTQSGVFVECMRHNTPVICLDEPGFRQFMDGCGILVSSEYNKEELLIAMQNISAQKEQFARSAKKIYFDNFSTNNFNVFYGTILDKIRSN